MDIGTFRILSQYRNNHYNDAIRLICNSGSHYIHIINSQCELIKQSKVFTMKLYTHHDNKGAEVCSYKVMHKCMQHSNDSHRLFKMLTTAYPTLCIYMLEDNIKDM